jgi:hypothetical protein
MGSYRVTKYNPEFRDERGAFLWDEWISVSDIGRAFDGVVLSAQEYLRIEDGYVLTLQRALEAAGIKSLVVRDLQLNPPSKRVAPSHIPIDETLVNGASIGGEALERLTRQALRGDLWCRLQGVGDSFVHFGYDYYMYVGGERVTIAPEMLAPGMYAEVFDSPYQTDE